MKPQSSKGTGYQEECTTETWNKKSRKFEGRVGASREKLIENSDLFRFQYFGSTEKKKKDANQWNKVRGVSSSKNANGSLTESIFLNASSNVLNTSRLGEKMDNESNEMVNRTEAAG